MFEPHLTSYLFAQPSFLSGMGSVLDIAGTARTYNDFATGAEADLAALSNDWMMVGADLHAAIRQYAEQQPTAAMQ